ncbi:WD40/YVTN/BNR-like repeat-containing protein [Dactylosporangium sp. NPDC051541]|uniref:WD40/YVTN/BNR-like repeat-containing protein n=1 Tax=Dactylosporangium sp. NPDC051541 TaxID=3363977 RepID=UPI003797C477
MRSRIVAIALGLTVVLSAGGFAKPPAPSWKLLDSGSTAQLRGLSAVSDRVAWASGTGGTVLRTVDGGRSWRSVGPPDAADLQLRDIEAFDTLHAVILSIGEGSASRVYRTEDGGRTWTETYRNADPAAFYDCLAFSDPHHGLALGDPVNGHFQLLSTIDGGRHWTASPVATAALDGEFAFAASGTCLVASGRDAWFATGGGAQSRVFHSGDFGRHWSVSAAPMPSGPTAGIYSLAFRDPHHGLAVGGDYRTPAAAPDGAAVSRDGGRTWTTARRAPGEYRSGVAWGPSFALAVGPTGSDISRDGGRTWTRFDTGSFDAVACADGACWASGEQGRIARLR